MASSKKTIIKEEQMDKDNSPSVVSYRVGLLEKAVKETVLKNDANFEKLNIKLDSYMDNFATKKEVAEIKEDVHNLKAMLREYPTVKSLVYGFTSLILLAVVTAVIYQVVAK